MDVFTFGKHRGEFANDVPISYLEWAVTTLASPPQEVISELRRRAAKHGSREAVHAASLLYGLGARRKPKAKKKKAPKTHVGCDYRPGGKDCPF